MFHFLSLNIYYFNLIIFLVISLVLVSVLLSLSYSVVYQNIDEEKLSSYECGFLPFEDAREQFNVRYYLVAILFLIFDLEVIFVVPFVISCQYLGLFGFWVFIFFLVILLIGFIYEWKMKALDWD